MEELAKYGSCGCLIKMYGEKYLFVLQVFIIPRRILTMNDKVMWFWTFIHEPG